MIDKTKLGPFDPYSAWYYSSDGGETYHGESDTRAQVIDEAKGNDPEADYLIAECHTHVLKLSQFFDVDRWLEDIEDNRVDDYMGEDCNPIFDMTPQHMNELQAAIRATIDNFQVQRGLRFRSWYFWKCVREEAVSFAPDCVRCKIKMSWNWKTDSWSCPIPDCDMIVDATGETRD